MHNLFVYGTLREGHMRNSVLSNSEFIGKVKTKKKYTLIDLSAFPGLLKDGNTKVTGELYKVDSDTLKICDQIEGHPNFYFRDFVDLANGLEAYAYFLPAKEYDYRPVVKSGDWFKK